MRREISRCIIECDECGVRFGGSQYAWADINDGTRAAVRSGWVFDDVRIPSTRCYCFECKDVIAASASRNVSEPKKGDRRMTFTTEDNGKGAKTEPKIVKGRLYRYTNEWGRYVVVCAAETTNNRLFSGQVRDAAVVDVECGDYDTGWVADMFISVDTPPAPRHIEATPENTKPMDILVGAETGATYLALENIKVIPLSCYNIGKIYDMLPLRLCHTGQRLVVSEG